MTKVRFFRLPGKTTKNKESLKKYHNENYHPHFITATKDYQITYLIVPTTSEMEKQAKLFLSAVNPVFNRIGVDLETWPTRTRKVKPYNDAALFAKFMMLGTQDWEGVDAVILLAETTDNLHYYVRALKRELQKVPLLSTQHLIVLSLEKDNRNLEFEQMLGSQWQIGYLPCPREFNNKQTSTIITEIANISLNNALGFEASSRRRAYSI